MKRMTRFIPGYLQSLQYNQTKMVYPTLRTGKFSGRKRAARGTWVGRNMLSTQQKYQMLLPCNSGHTLMGPHLEAYQRRRGAMMDQFQHSSRWTVVVMEWQGLCWVWALTHVVFLLDLPDNLCICWSAENPLCSKSCEMRAGGEERSAMWESLKMLVLTIINPCCGAFRQMSTSPFFIVQQLFLLPLPVKGYKEHFATLIQGGVWMTGRKRSPKPCTISLEG